MKTLLTATAMVTALACTMPASPPVEVSTIGKLELEQIVKVKSSKKGKELNLKIKPVAEGLIQAGIFNEKGERLKLIDLSDSGSVSLEGIPEGVYVMRVVDEARNMNMYRIEKRS